VDLVGVGSGRWLCSCGARTLSVVACFSCFACDLCCFGLWLCLLLRGGLFCCCLCSVSVFLLGCALVVLCFLLVVVFVSLMLFRGVVWGVVWWFLVVGVFFVVFCVLVFGCGVCLFFLFLEGSFIMV